MKNILISPKSEYGRHDAWKKKIIVVHANGMHWKKASVAIMVVNIVQISDALMIVVNVGRV